MTLINLTPHAITVRSCFGVDEVFPPSGHVARCSSIISGQDPIDGIPVICTRMGEVEGVPEPVGGTAYIVSSMVASHPSLRGRLDVVAPNTGPAAIRENGQIVAVCGFQRF